MLWGPENLKAGKALSLIRVLCSSKSRTSLQEGNLLLDAFSYVTDIVWRWMPDAPVTAEVSGSVWEPAGAWGSLLLSRMNESGAGKYSDSDQHSALQT